MGESLKHHQSFPVVFPAAIHDWPAAKWTPQILSQTLQDQELRFRVGKKQNKGVQWEGDCDYRSATLAEFLEWESGGALPPDHPLSHLNPSQHWCYCDYKHMPEIFHNQPEILKSVDWGRFGLAGRDGLLSTFWLGSSGAHTQCHYDTYGCNMIAQIYGRKRWVLFPPSDTSHMYPTRIPYEESSVFSQVNVTSPNLTSHTKYTRTSPHVVILDPGDVMFVPRHWWHDVTSLTTSISVNTWIELPTDSLERVREAVTRFVVMATMESRPSIPDSTWQNPTEDVTESEENLEYLQKSLEELKKVEVKSLKGEEEGNEDGTEREGREEESDCSFPKKAKMDTGKDSGSFDEIDNSGKGKVEKNETKMNFESSKNTYKLMQDESDILCGCPKMFQKYHLEKNQNMKYVKMYTFPEYMKYLEGEKLQTDSTEVTLQSGSKMETEFKVFEPKSDREIENMQESGGGREKGDLLDSIGNSHSEVEENLKMTSPLDSLHLTLLESLTHPSVMENVCQILMEKLNK